ncbi:hypothetical protein [Terrihabitans sp. B22-R8]|uniref:hypothetical protein n=1 Tax=Terrihabitans sp. B22-R8 TaxID=3425128 RepID=UPI00403C6053
MDDKASLINALAAGMRRRPIVWSIHVLIAALALAGCKGEPATSKHPLPDWSGAAIEGIAPLMSPSQVEAALKAGNYRTIPCSPTSSENPRNELGEMSCYASPDRPMKISLRFLDLPEGRRLATANFREHPSGGSDEDRTATSRAFADELTARFGPPDDRVDKPTFTVLFWKRPGGLPEHADMVITIVGPAFGANAGLQSPWAEAEAGISEPVSEIPANVPAD